MVWRQTGEGPVFERMMTQVAKHVYATGGGLFLTLSQISDLCTRLRIELWRVKLEFKTET